MKKRIIAICLAVVVLTGTVGTSALAASGSDWLNSGVEDVANQNTQVSEKDDYYTAINFAWNQNAVIPSGQLRTSSFDERNDVISNQMISILEDQSIKGHEAEITQNCYQNYLDWETRNALGVTPVMPYIERIQKINTIEDMTNYLTTEKDILGDVLFHFMVDIDYKNSTQYAVFIDGTSFFMGDSAEYRQITEQGKTRKAIYDEYIPQMLEKIGYSKEDAVALWNAAFAFETKLAQPYPTYEEQYQSDFFEKAYHAMTKEELFALAGNYPVLQRLCLEGYPYSDKYVVYTPEYFTNLSHLYTEENLGEIKAYMLVCTAQNGMRRLDRSCYELSTEMSNALYGSEGIQEEKIYASEYTNSLLGEALGKLYVQKYVSAKTKQDIEAIIQEIIVYYKQMLQGEEWLTEATRQKAVEKLDAIKVRAAYPDQWKDYTDLKIEKLSNEYSMIDMILAISEFENKENAKKVNQAVDPNEWIMLPQTVNAGYNPADNSINIPAGILGGVFYQENGTDAENLGGIGAVIGHEITHAFDPTGSRYDKDGNMNDWWTEQDREAFEQRSKAVNAYYGAMEALPGQYVNGELTKGETVADLGAMQCMLTIAKSRPDFDYAKFFETFAVVWRQKMKKEYAAYVYTVDPHAPNYLRTNVTIQQFQEFYDTYDIKAGDGMYLEPKDRLHVW